MLSISNFNKFLTAFYSETLNFAYMIFKQNEHSQLNPSETFPSSGMYYCKPISMSVTPCTTGG